MAQKAWLSALAGATDFMKNLAEAVINHGGSEDDLKKLIKDPELLAACAKMMVGSVWDLVMNDVELRVDWDMPMNDFVPACIRVSSHTVLPSRQLFVASSAQWDPLFNDRRPDPTCTYRYRLAHFERNVTYKEVTQTHNVAGFRELCAYAMTVSIPEGISVVAMDAYFPGQNGEIYDCPTVVDVEAKRPIRSINRPEFSPRHFFLIRVPQVIYG